MAGADFSGGVGTKTFSSHKLVVVISCRESRKYRIRKDKRAKTGIKKTKETNLLKIVYNMLLSLGVLAEYRSLASDAGEGKKQTIVSQKKSVAPNP